MKAIVQERYGPIEGLEVREVDRPTIDGDQVLVRVRATSVHADVWHMVSGFPYVLRIMGGGFRRPNHPIPGTDVAGTIEAIGPEVTRFQVGDDVYGEIVTGNQWRNGGAFAEFAAARQGLLERKPARLSFEEAAAVPTSGAIALRALRDEGALTGGMRMLVNGAGGGVGIFAVQIGKADGAHVTGVDSAEKLDMLRSIGADVVLDYHTEDFTAGDERYDLILDVASTRSFAECRRVLTPEGRYVLIGHDHFGATGHRWIGSTGTFLKLLVRMPFTRQLPRPSFKEPAEPLLVSLTRLVEDGKITPVIDRTFALDQVQDALRYLIEGDPRGKIILTI
jgi:NADPH:quinone reductase-like Zn-dependent oxidoreductase